MAREKGIIPRNAQVPVAVVLALAFGGLLAIRAARSEERGAPQVLAANRDVQHAGETDTSNGRVPIDDMRNLIAEFRADASQSSGTRTRAPSLDRNPFLVPERALAKIVQGDSEGIEGRGGESNFDFSEARELHSLVLTGTSKIGETYMAIVNGMVLGEGDRIEGYTIVGVEEGVLVLENKRGTRIVRMKEREAR